MTNKSGVEKSNKFLAVSITGLLFHETVPKNLIRVRTMAGSPVVIGASAKHTATVRQFLSTSFTLWCRSVY